LPPTGPLCSQRSTAGVRDCDAAALRGLSAPHILKLVVLLRVSSACSYIQRWRTWRGCFFGECELRRSASE
jgi:hypothetical protein